MPFAAFVGSQRPILRFRDRRFSLRHHRDLGAHEVIGSRQGDDQNQGHAQRPDKNCHSRAPPLREMYEPRPLSENSPKRPCLPTADFGIPFHLLDSITVTLFLRMGYGRDGQRLAMFAAPHVLAAALPVTKENCRREWRPAKFERNSR